MKKYLVLIVVFLPMFVFGQTLEDALRYSTSDNYSTARSMGVAGSFGAMGADFGSISHNPATLGNFWRSEFDISFGYNSGNGKAHLGRRQNNKIDGYYSFNNVGFVSNSKRSSGNWVSTNFAIGLNKVSSFNNFVDVSGNTRGSAFESPNLIDQSNIDYEPYNDIPINKHQVIDDAGSINEMVFALAGNFKKRLLFGVSLGIPFLNFSTSRKYSEVAPAELQNDKDFYFTSLKYDEEYRTDGVGLNLKAGMIYIMPNNIRFGLAVHTPTSFKLKDDYSREFSAESNNYYIDSISQAFYFDYKLSTPWKVIGSVGSLFKRDALTGFINFDAEYVGYNTAKYNLTKYSNEDFDAENEKFQNDEINDKLTSAFNFRLGSEIGYKYLRFRLGGALMGNPFKDNDGYKPDITYSAGLGYRSNGYFIDIAFITTSRSFTYLPYVAEEESRSTEIGIESNFNKLNLTFGVKF